jgi:hypothetical protein
VAGYLALVEIWYQHKILSFFSTNRNYASAVLVDTLPNRQESAFEAGSERRCWEGLFGTP